MSQNTSQNNQDPNSSPVETFSDELEGEEIYFRDIWQLEQKSDFLPDPALKTNHYTQEIYFFIPHALQINATTYPTAQFYRDEINLIRFKTPVFTLREVLELPSSPLTKIKKLKEEPLTPKTQEEIEEELKLLGNVVRSSVRTSCQHLIHLLHHKEFEKTREEGEKLLLDIETFFDAYGELSREVLRKWDIESLHHHFTHVELFLRRAIGHYLTLLLERVRAFHPKQFKEFDGQLVRAIEKQGLDPSLLHPKSEREEENVVYEKALLNKFILNALLLQINRFSPTERYKNFIAALAAGIAMLFFLIFFVKQNEWFIVNSTSFILFTVFLYILKDRIKEWLREISAHQRLGWLSDYTTKIQSPDGKYILGKLHEKVSFIPSTEVPEEIYQIRNQEFHAVISFFKRPESVLYYKKKIRIFEKPVEIESRRFMLNIISRFNVHPFLEKASNPLSTYHLLNPETKVVEIKHFPKVYHINLIVKTTITRPDQPPKIELHKIRLIADKNGIKRVEYL